MMRRGADGDARNKTIGAATTFEMMSADTRGESQPTLLGRDGRSVHMRF